MRAFKPGPEFLSCLQPPSGVLWGAPRVCRWLVNRRESMLVKEIRHPLQDNREVYGLLPIIVSSLMVS